MFDGRFCEVCQFGDFVPVLFIIVINTKFVIAEQHIVIIGTAIFEKSHSPVKKKR